MKCKLCNNKSTAVKTIYCGEVVVETFPVCESHILCDEERWGNQSFFSPIETGDTFLFEKIKEWELSPKEIANFSEKFTFLIDGKIPFLIEWKNENKNLSDIKFFRIESGCVILTHEKENAEFLQNFKKKVLSI